MAKRPSVTFVIMAGGKGERLWPLVRRDRPKVCLPIDGSKSLLWATIQRLDGAWPRAEWLIVTTNEQAGPITAMLPAAWRSRILVEPQTKNTAACITLAAALIASRDPDRILVVLPADHWIGEGGRFRAAVRMAIQAAARQQAIVTIGVRPAHPHPGLGYLCAGQRIGGSNTMRLCRLNRFVEKPSRRDAQRLCRQAGTYWNIGIFVGPAETFLEGVTEWLPDHARRLASLAMQGKRALRSRSRGAYARLEPISFDHGVMAHLRGGLVVATDFSWADLGNWDTWARGTRATSRTVAVDSPGLTVVSEPGHCVAAVGVRDLIIVQTRQATLVCARTRTQDVRRVVERLAADPRLATFV